MLAGLSLLLLKRSILQIVCVVQSERICNTVSSDGVVPTVGMEGVSKTHTQDIGRVELLFQWNKSLICFQN